MKKKSPTKRREDQKNEEREKMKKTLQENKGQMQKRKKKYQKHRANSKEEIVTISQMNILPFPITTLQANDKSYLISFFMFSY